MAPGEVLDTVIARLAERQHGAVARWQLVALGIGKTAIDKRIADGRLRRVHRGVYAVGSLDLRGHWMAAVLACGEAEVDGIPVTSVARTLLDLAEVVPLQQLRRAYEAAERHGLLDIQAVHELVARSNGRRGLSWEHHGHRAAFERDNSKLARLQVAGYTVLPFTDRRLRYEARLGRRLGAGSARPGAGGEDRGR